MTGFTFRIKYSREANMRKVLVILLGIVAISYGQVNKENCEEIILKIKTCIKEGESKYRCVKQVSNEYCTGENCYSRVLSEVMRVCPDKLRNLE